jgi:acyl-CoA thioester hydrolase
MIKTKMPQLLRYFLFYDNYLYYMARLKLELPPSSKFLFTTNIDVRITDINYGNHVGNDAFVGIIHEARVKWLTHNNYTELRIADGVGLIMSSIAVEFKNESFYGDIIEITIFCGEISKAGFELCYQLKTVRKSLEILLAVAKTDMITYDYPNKKVVTIPEIFRQCLL